MWFEGKVADAIAKAKTESKLLMVFVCGNDDTASAVVSHHFDDLGVVHLSSNSPMVCIKIRAKSAMAAQFGQIYPLPTIPMLYIIGTDGLPQEIIAGEIAKNSMITKLENVIKKFGGGNTEPGPSANSAVQSSVQVEAGATKESKNEASAEHSPVQLQEKVDRAQELLEKRRIQKEQEAKENEKEEEKQRRATGKAMQEQQAKRDEKERKELTQERKKKKTDDKAALDRIRMQIAQDRAEKQQRFDSKKAEEQAALLTAKKDKEKKKIDEENALLADRSNEARIQFRLPSGRAIAHKFDADAKLQEAYDFIKQHAEEFGKFELRQMLPRREFSAEQMQQSFRELQLAPSAVLIIIPESGKLVRGNSTSDSLFSSIWAMITAPFVFIYTMIATFLGFPPSITDGRAPNNRRPNETRNGPNRLGNVGSRNPEDNATYNGNSTQQL